MTHGTGYGVLTDAQWDKLAALIEQCRQPHKTAHDNLRRTIEAIVWRRELAQYSVASGAMCLGASAGTGAAARRDQAGDGVSRWHHHPDTPESRWCGKKGGSSAQRDKRKTLGRSRGGFSTKACVLADGSGRAIGFALAPGQANELPMAPVLLSFLTALALWIVADRGYSSHAFRMLIWGLGSRPAIPAKRNEAPVACPSWIYTNRNLVERCWSRLKLGRQN